MKNSAEVIARLEQEWDLETGFLGLLRQGTFDAQKLSRLLDTLREISYGDDDTIHRRIVSLLWFIPLFMEWRQERSEESCQNATDITKSLNLIQTEIERILGVP